MKKIITLLFVLASFRSLSQSVVISQVYGGGGNSGATYINDFIELFNPTAAAISVNGWSVQYNSATSTTSTWQITNLPNVSIQPGQHFLIQEAAGAGGTTALPTPDVIGTIALSATAGKVVLVNNTTAFAIQCPSTGVLDLVGFGATANCFEGAGAAPAPTNTTAILRLANGCTDANNNAADFITGAPNPRNTSSTLTPCGGGSPTLSATALTAFGNVCINTTAGPNSFTITGTALTAVNITIGGLAGYTYSTTSGGTYTATLSLPQSGGAYTQDIFVKFTPTAVQSYSGNIAVGGGGAPSVNVAASGAGVNAPVVTTGSASPINATTATLAGTIVSIGCTPVTAYGVEYSTVNNFPNGTGTAVPSTNLSGGNFSSDLTGLTASTLYYYHAYATNGAGTSYGAQQSFTTTSGIPPAAGLVISQIYGNGGNTGASYNADYVELFNNSTAPITMTGYSIQYGTATVTTAWSGVAALPTATIPAGGYYLIQMSAAGATGSALPAPDAVASPAINMSATAGRVALVNGTTALVGCPASSAYVDLVGFGTTASCFQGSGPAGAQAVATTADLRKLNGCTNTPDNAGDFQVLTTAPRNSASPVNICGAATPVLTATALTAFGAQCINGVYGPNSFTITGTNLTAANVTVGPLPGYTYSTTAGGTYTASLSLTQPGGAYSQQIFVKFSPTAVQSYNGNIAVGGGGTAAATNVAASGSGVNTIPAVTTGAASLITTSTATLAGTITSNGCSAITAYGVEYSTTNNFPNGTGTAVPSTNISGGNFTSNISGLTASTVYYYHAYATNNGGTGYGSQQTFTTTGAPSLSATALTAFGAQCINGTYGPNSFTITGANLTNANVTVGPLAGFTYSTTAGGTYTASLSLVQPGGAYSQQIFVNFNPTAIQSYNGNIPVGGGGTASTINVAASGSGVNAIPTVTSGAASAITAVSATVAGTINSVGCSAITAYGVEYSITNNFPNGTGTPVTSANLSGGNFTSALSGLSPATTYYYHAYATNGGGTGYGAQQQFTTATPGFSATALTGFGNVCLNSTAGPNSFTITGTNLSSANVTVGALAGFTYSTTAGGTYTTTLSLTQPGGSFSQQVFVQFTPTAVQSYNGNIPVGGGGSSSINVAASGAGVNTIPSLTTGGASAITTVSATTAGTINSIGCSPVTAYGIEYSIIPGFANGTGTAVASTNLAGGNFTSDLTGLTPGTTYYYHAYATNNGGTGYGAEQFFTTGSLTPTLTTTGLAPFGSQCVNNTYGPNSFTINGSSLSNANVNVAALAGYTYSTTAGGTYTATLSLTQPGGTYSQQIFVNFTPTAAQSYNGNIVVSGGGAPVPANVAASGSGINTQGTVTTGAASAITSTSATTAGSITATGCSAISAYGIEYSTINGFANGTGTAVPSTNIAAGNFSSNLTGLTASTTYYYHAYATNGGGTAYGAQQQFTTATPVLSASALTGFGNVCLNTTVGPNSFTIAGTNLTGTNVTVGPLAGYTFSTTAGGTYTASLSLTQPGGSYAQQVFVKFTPTAVQSYNGNIPVSGGGAATANVAVTGAGINTQATVTTGAASAITSTSATAAGTIPSIGCSPVTAYGIEYSTTNGFPNGTGTAVASTNLVGTNFSSNLTGLTPTTTYYYHAFATNAGGTVYGTQQQFTTATPVISANALTGFGAVCLNTTVGPNTFTITGTNLTAANITVGPLNGFSFSTTAGGTYTASLSLTQPSGSYSQQIFVKFTPTAVQSYSGNIPVSGGGATSVNVAAAGSGINTVASVTSGAASAVTQISATVGGTIPSTGCSAITFYGIEYSTTAGFANGTGTAVPSTNLAGTAFSSNLTGLTPATTYYYHAYATNNGGTVYGAQGSFTTLAPVLTSSALAGFGPICVNSTAGPNTFTITSNALLGANVNVGPLNGYSFSTSASGPYTSTLSLTHPTGAYSQTIYVMFTPTAVQSYNGNIPVNGGGAPLANNVAVTGRGINTISSVTTGNASVLSPNSVTLNGSIAGTGCSPVTTYGFVYSGISGFANGNGTAVAASNLSGGSFSATITGLVQGATYYYKAWGANSGGVAYGAQQSFTLTAIPNGLKIYSTPIPRGGNVHITLDSIKPGHYAIRIFNSAGQLVFQKDMIIAVNFIDTNFTLPAILGTGKYSLQIWNPEFRTERSFMIW